MKQPRTMNQRRSKPTLDPRRVVTMSSPVPTMLAVRMRPGPMDLRMPQSV
jgi:hypothetical protein